MVQQTLIYGKYVAQGFVGRALVDKHGRNNSKGGRCVKGGLGNRYRYYDKQGSHVLCIKSLLAPEPTTSSQSGKGVPFNSEHLNVFTDLTCLAHQFSFQCLFESSPVDL